MVYLTTLKEWGWKRLPEATAEVKERKDSLALIYDIIQLKFPKRIFIHLLQLYNT